MRAGDRAARLVRGAERGPRRRRPALLQVVRRRHAERLLQLPRPPRDAGRGERVAFHWRGEEGEERDITYARAALADVQRFANALQATCGVEKGDVVGIYLPMIPEVVVAMLALRADRRAPQRRLRRLLGGVRARADGVLRGQGARHRRRRPPQGQDGAGQDQVDEHMGELESLETIVVVRHAGTDCPMKRGPRRLLRRDLAAADPACPPEPLDAEHPLYILYTSGLDRQAEGHPAHDRRLPDRGHRHPSLRVRPQAGVRRLLVRRRRRLGHRPLLHRLRPARQRRHQRDVGGRTRLPAQGHLVGDRRALRGDDPLLRADRDPHLHQVGRGVPRQARSLLAAPARAPSASRSTPRPGSGTTR